MGDSQPRRLEERVAREVLLALALLAVAMLQTSLMPRPLGFPLNLILILAVCQALIVSTARATRWAFYGGLALDFCSASLLGMHALALLVAVLAASLPLTRMSRENWLLPLLGMLFGTIAYYIVFGALTYLFAGAFDLRVFMLVAVLPDTLATLIPALPLFLLWRTWRRRGEVPVDVY